MTPGTHPVDQSIVDKTFFFKKRNNPFAWHLLEERSRERRQEVKDPVFLKHVMGYERENTRLPGRQVAEGLNKQDKGIFL
ncbi:MAG: hypothetical protein OEQ39_08180 [Gammaproteobacteria bacterium]|nr:hypothetical protein [Gammaproteobacteria bacterium]MDH3466767.1 hypothetical protein [Gammaproteobacteria bacterium]